MNTIMGIVGGVLGLVALVVYVKMTGRKGGKVAGTAKAANTTPKTGQQPAAQPPKTVVGQPVAEHPKEAIIRKLLAKGVISQADAEKVRETIRTEAAQPQMAVEKVIARPSSVFGTCVPVSDAPGKYRAMIFTDEGDHNIVFRTIPMKLGNTVTLEPSMPKRGGHYLIVQQDGEWRAYDPRLEPLVSAETPQAAFDSVTVYDLVAACYANKYGLWDKINTILIACMGAGFILVAIVGIDKMGGK
jgi:hypothetical protein